MMEWQSYEPNWLIELAKKQKPEIVWLPEALSKCTKCKRESDAYICFSSTKGPNNVDMFCIELNHPVKGLIILDVNKGKRLGKVFIEDKQIIGVEFVDKIQNR